MPTEKGYVHIIHDNMRSQIEAIGEYMESVTSPLPYPGVRLKGDEFNVSTIVEASTIKLARECDRVTKEQWKRYLDVYLQARKVSPEARAASPTKRRIGERLIFLSEAAQDAIQEIADCAKAHIPEQYLYAPPTRKLSNKLVIALALQHAAENLPK